MRFFDARSGPSVFAGMEPEVARLDIRPARRFRDLRRRFLHNRWAMVGLVMLAILFLTALFAPVLAPYDPNRQDLYNIFQPPSWDHPFGTDALGRDQLSRVIYGSRLAALVGLISVPVALSIAIAVGASAGYFGGRWDTGLMRVVDAFYAFPSYFGLIVIILVVGRGWASVVLALSVFGWATMARVLRGGVLSVREAPFVEAARAIGATHWRVVTRHVLPNSLSPVLVMAVVRVGTAVLALAGLSFLGIGVEPGDADWGSMVAAGNQYFGLRDYLWALPALAVVFAVLSFVLVGDGLRDALEPTRAD